MAQETPSPAGTSPMRDPPGPVAATLAHEPPAGQTDPQPRPRLEFRHKARFVWKVTLLLITFIALIPILLYQDVLGAKVYLWFLVGVHVVGLGVFGWGVSRHDIAPSMRGFAMRLLGLVAVAALLYLASKGLHTEFGTVLFWSTLFALWAIHTGGLLLLHVRGRNETTCPFA